MVGVGVLMLLLAWIGAWVTRGRAGPPRWLLWGFAGFTFSGWIATLAGWIVTEIGRQPWLVHRDPAHARRRRAASARRSSARASPATSSSTA